MDKKQLVTIVITAVISVTAKELFAWLFSLMKITVVNETVRQKARKLFSKNNRRIMFDIFCLLFTGIIMSHDLLRSTPITRLDIVLIVLDMLAIAVFGGRLLWHLTYVTITTVYKDDTVTQIKPR